MTTAGWPMRKSDERATTDRFLARAHAFYRRHGLTVEQVMTDNGSASRATVHALACRQLGIRHLRTRPYRPQTNGTAFIRTLLEGWAYGAIHGSSSERAAALDGRLRHYQPSTSTLSPRPPSPGQQDEPAAVLHPEQGAESTRLDPRSPAMRSR
jgi:transposase InsO family protein